MFNWFKSEEEKLKQEIEELKKTVLSYSQLFMDLIKNYVEHELDNIIKISYRDFDEIQKIVFDIKENKFGMVTGTYVIFINRMNDADKFILNCVKEALETLQEELNAIEMDEFMNNHNKRHNHKQHIMREAFSKLTDEEVRELNLFIVRAYWELSPEERKALGLKEPIIVIEDSGSYN